MDPEFETESESQILDHHQDPDSTLIAMSPNPKGEDGYDVFISYARKNEAIVVPFCNSLRSHGISAFLDQGGGIVEGEWWDEEIGKAIRTCKVMLLMASRAAFESPEVTNEIRTIRNLDGEKPDSEKRKILPIHIEKGLKNSDYPDAYSFLLGVQRPPPMVGLMKKESRRRVLEFLRTEIAGEGKSGGRLQTKRSYALSPVARRNRVGLLVLLLTSLTAWFVGLYDRNPHIWSEHPGLIVGSLVAAGISPVILRLLFLVRTGLQDVDLWSVFVRPYSALIEAPALGALAVAAALTAIPPTSSVWAAEPPVLLILADVQRQPGEEDYPTETEFVLANGMIKVARTKDIEFLQDPDLDTSDIVTRLEKVEYLAAIPTALKDDSCYYAFVVGSEDLYEGDWSDLIPAWGKALYGDEERVEFIRVDASQWKAGTKVTALLFALQGSVMPRGVSRSAELAIDEVAEVQIKDDL